MRFDVTLPAMSLGLKLCASREGGTGESGGVSALGRGNVTASGLDLEKPWLELGGPFLFLLCTNGLRKQSSHLVGPPFLQAVKHLSRSKWAMAGRESPLMGGCG